MESLEIAHKLLQLITRTLIQMMTLNQKVWNPPLFLSLPGHFFLLLVCFGAHVCLSLYVNVLLLCMFYLCVCVTEGVCVCVCWGRARGLVHPGERTGGKGISDPSLRSSSLLLCAVMGCLRGWRFPWQRKPCKRVALCAPRVMRSGLLKVAREGWGTKW